MKILKKNVLSFLKFSNFYVFHILNSEVKN
jgi:hypothetical protein